MLEDIIVLEAGHQVAAPACTMLLSDMGAEVWKIERPGQGDGTRNWNLTKPGGAFYALNRNKKSISLDIKQGKDVFLSLAKKADVLVENLAPGAMKKYGLDYDSVSALNPRIIYCSISGYGSGGPYTNLPGWDPVIEALSGYMSLIGREEEPFSRAPSSTFDQFTGTFAALGILGALRQREKTGTGSKVEVSLLETMISVLGYLITDYSMTGTTPKRQGAELDFRAPYGVFRTKTQPIYVAVAEEVDWSKFCKAMDLSNLQADERFSTRPRRVSNKQALREKIEEAFSELESREIVRRLVEFDVPCAPVNTIAEALSDPQVLSRNMVVDLKVPDGETVKVANTPINFSGPDARPFAQPPRIGAHTNTILQECGYTEADIASLRERGIL